MRGFRLAALIVALANLAYFGIEFTVGLAIGSVSLFADSIDFLEDASVNLLIAFGLGWSAQRRARQGVQFPTKSPRRYLPDARFFQLEGQHRRQ